MTSMKSKKLETMEHLQSLMRCVDDISEIIPEGTYLEMCNKLKCVHENMPKHDDPPVVETRRIPFQVVQGNMAVYRLENETDSDDDEEDDEDYFSRYDEWVENECTLQRLLVDLKVTEKSLKTLKPIGNITKNVRDMAIKDFCNNDPRCVGYGEWTFENLNENTLFSNEEERRGFTSKKHERMLYLDYKTRYNRNVDRLTREARELKRNLEIEISEVRGRQEMLRPELL
jgi:hypothetical protein